MRVRIGTDIPIDRFTFRIAIERPETFYKTSQRFGLLRQIQVQKLATRDACYVSKKGCSIGKPFVSKIFSSGANTMTNHWKKHALQATVALLSSAAFVSAWAWQPGRMTGGGSIICPDIGRVTHGFELHCANNDPAFDNAPGPNNLEINFANGNNFHLTALTYSYCSDDASIAQAPPKAWFDTLNGHGTGLFNGNPAEIFFVLDDAGEPGTLDFASFLINSGGQTVLQCHNLLDRGNQQAHND